MNVPPKQTADGLEQVDHLLRDFFRSEMPDPWPGCPVPKSVDSYKTKSRNGLRRSYLGLAACCAFVALGLGVAWNLLRFDPPGVSEAGVLPAAAKPVPKGSLFRNPPATLPQPSGLKDPGMPPHSADGPEVPEEAPPMPVSGPRRF